ncbi:leucine-rich repeat protein [Perkinsela sp. CCAP 1560/4]|nr:leucine-rich repeat protein [Perkinsela sp. CCAP 1560/4]|eukprot:KNH04162.1 leucine-rich repeat protein [Perkinsela sp. CCAP 1560/4]
MRLALFCLDTLDPLLGRLDYASLSQQALMELVIEEIINKQKICGDSNEPQDIDDWLGVKLEDDKVVEIDWNSSDLTGLLHLQWLPSSVCTCTIILNQLAGTLDLASLPVAMKQLGLGINAFTGCIDLERLPENMESFAINSNQLSGSLKLGSLPKTLTQFNATYNKFSGCIDLTQLPAALTGLYVSNNQLSALTRRKDTSPWWVGPVPQFWGKPRTFSNPLSCFCHGADPIDGHRKVVGQDQYPALGEVRETAKLLPRGESPWWRDEGRHLLILCLFSIRGMRLAHMHNAKSREHAHTCRKARAIFKLRYKNKTKQIS